MEIVVLDSPEQIAQRAADLIEGVLAERPDAVLGTATGSSPLPLYEELARRCSSGRLSLARVTAFMLDEYVGLPDDHSERYHAFMERHLQTVTDLPAESLHGPEAPAGADADALEVACRRYEDAMAAAGYCDLQILGIGSDGHIGFNEPGGPLDSRTHVGVLAESTRRDNARFFEGDVDAVPTRCLTQGLATIMEARRLVLIATGEGKASAVAAMVDGPVSEDLPASVLQQHDDALILLDPAAASGLTSCGRVVTAA
ncbi:glucosamine-6-phosphate deaminase [Actinomyces haliotis]|uniref:glucosamine-6-phosphate deaminase n=1 Tax=Actinomyces haliotis TaxID=1280843 RepID=UPI00188FD6FF|nr:glucosamine-6-phosphate deaminase [Actinomyces haliotis]